MRDSSQSESWEALLELCRKDVAKLSKLKHPGIVKVVEPFEETRSQMVMVTEQIFASLTNVLSDFEGLPAEVQRSNEDLQMSDLERKHGLLQVADTLQFLNQDCNLVHRALCPDAIMLVGGAFKLALMGFSVMSEFSTESTVSSAFQYSAADTELQRLLKPPLRYVAPELIAGTQTSAGLSSAADTYSFAAMAYEVLARQPLMAPRSTPAEVAGRLAGLALMPFPKIDLQLLPVLRSMLSPTVLQRQSVGTFVGSPYFQEDTLVRALRFLDSLLQRDDLQKVAFLKDLNSFWPRFDARILRYKVLPALLEELRNETVAVLALPLVMRIVTKQAPRDFMDFTLPILLPVAASAKGDSLTLLTRSTTALAPSLPPEAVKELIVPLLCRAADHGDACAQEEMLKALPELTQLGTLEVEDLSGELLPRVCGTCLATTSALVRTGALTAMGRLVKHVDQDEAIKMLATCQQVTSVDKTPGSVMCVLGLAGVVAKRWGCQMAAVHVLPVLCPLLVAPALTQAQFSSALRAIREMLTNVEAFRSEHPQASGDSLPVQSYVPIQASISSKAIQDGSTGIGAPTQNFESSTQGGGSTSSSSGAGMDPFNMMVSGSGGVRSSGITQSISGLPDFQFKSQTPLAATGMRKGTPSMGKAPEKDDFGDFFSPSHQQAPDQYQDSTSSSVAKQNYSSLI